MRQAVVEVGARLRYDGRVWRVAVLEGPRATLPTDKGTSAVVLLPYLFADPSFGVEGTGRRRGKVPPLGMLEACRNRCASGLWRGSGICGRRRPAFLTRMVKAPRVSSSIRPRGAWRSGSGRRRRS